MRIAFAGGSCTGKSTLSKIIAEKTGMPYIEEGLERVFDMCWEHGRPLNVRDIRKLDAPSLAIFEDMMSRYIQAAEENFDRFGFITDSSATVHLMYLYTMSWHMDAETFATVEQRYVEQQSKYDLVFYLPSGVLPLVDDGVRRVNKNLMTMQGWVLDRLIDHVHHYVFSKAQVHKITAPSLEDRVNYVMRVIDAYKNPPIRTSPFPPSHFA